jgi:hypothetical protein
MARQIKPKESHHTFSGYADSMGDGNFEIHLSRGGPRRTYLWVGPSTDRVRRISTYSGEKFLRALAEAILREVGR